MLLATAATCWSCREEVRFWKKLCTGPQTRWCRRPAIVVSSFGDPEKQEKNGCTEWNVNQVYIYSVDILKRLSWTFTELLALVTGRPSGHRLSPPLPARLACSLYLPPPPPLLIHPQCLPREKGKEHHRWGFLTSNHHAVRLCVCSWTLCRAALASTVGPLTLRCGERQVELPRGKTSGAKAVVIR